MDFFFYTQNSFPQVSEEFLYEWVTVVAFQVDIDWIRAMVASVTLHIGKILFIRNKKKNIRQVPLGNGILGLNEVLTHIKKVNK